MIEYSTELFTASIAMADYLERFHDRRRFEELCRQCPCYGARWCCPPLTDCAHTDLHRYTRADLMLLKVTPLQPGAPLEQARDIIRRERIALERTLLERERALGGLAVGLTGDCPYCGPDAVCARTAGEPCRHPELVRPSLEALGFDVARTAEELFGTPILWSRDATLPPYLTLVCGHFV